MNNGGRYDARGWLFTFYPPPDPATHATPTGGHADRNGMFRRIQETLEAVGVVDLRVIQVDNGSEI